MKKASIVSGKFWKLERIDGNKVIAYYSYSTLVGLIIPDVLNVRGRRFEAGTYVSEGYYSQTTQRHKNKVPTVLARFEVPITVLDLITRESDIPVLQTLLTMLTEVFTVKGISMQQALTCNEFHISGCRRIPGRCINTDGKVYRMIFNRAGETELFPDNPTRFRIPIVCAISGSTHNIDGGNGEGYPTNDHLLHTAIDCPLDR